MYSWAYGPFMVIKGISKWLVVSFNAVIVKVCGSEKEAILKKDKLNE